LGLVSCLSDRGVINPDAGGNLPPLAQFRGKALNVGDTTLSGKKILAVRFPRVALVWQFAGLRAYRDTHEKGLVSTALPFEFSGELRDPPPPDVVDHGEVAIGELWLYSDRNGNGSLDRLIHPELVIRNRAIDSLQRRFDSLVRDLKRLAVRGERRTAVQDTFSILPDGGIVRLKGGKQDTIWRKTPGVDVGLWADVIRSRYRILADLDAWEAFLILRLRMDDRTLRTIPDGGRFLTVAFGDRIRLEPAEGSEAEFESVLERAAAARMELFYTFQTAYVEGMKNGWHDYPYDGFDAAGEDWVVGRSRRFFILYLKNGEMLRQLREAETISAFTIAGMDGLHAGYNLIHCDAQYRCEVRSFRDSIEIELGDKEAYFNPPSEVPQKPLADPRPAQVPEDSLAAFAGSYDYLPLEPLEIVAKGGYLWVDIPGTGLFRFVPAGGNRFFSPATGMQMKFAFNPDGKIEKVFAYVAGEQGVAKPMVSGEGWQRMKGKVDSLAAVVPVARDPAVWSAYAGRFEAGKDTVKTEAAADGTGLQIKLPGMAAQIFTGIGDGRFQSAEADLGLRFETGKGGLPANLIYRKGGIEYLYPNLAPVPMLDSAFVPVSGDTSGWGEASSHSGSAPDTYRGPDGKSRYTCPDDGKFLRSGDGGLDSLIRQDDGDAISLKAGGDRARFKVTGLAGKAAAFDWFACGSSTDPVGKVLLRFRGGGAPGAAGDALAEDRWVKMERSGVHMTAGPIRIPSDPYYVEVIRLRTAEAERPFAFDRYRISAEGSR
jgi:hypothetical protein